MQNTIPHFYNASCFMQINGHELKAITLTARNSEMELSLFTQRGDKSSKNFQAHQIQQFVIVGDYWGCWIQIHPPVIFYCIDARVLYDKQIFRCHPDHKSLPWCVSQGLVWKFRKANIETMHEWQLKTCSHLFGCSVNDSTTTWQRTYLSWVVFFWQRQWCLGQRAMAIY